MSRHSADGDGASSGERRLVGANYRAMREPNACGVAFFGAIGFSDAKSNLGGGGGAGDEFTGGAILGGARREPMASPANLTGSVAGTPTRVGSRTSDGAEEAANCDGLDGEMVERRPCSGDDVGLDELSSSDSGATNELLTLADAPANETVTDGDALDPENGDALAHDAVADGDARDGGVRAITAGGETTDGRTITDGGAVAFD